MGWSTPRYIKTQSKTQAIYEAMNLACHGAVLDKTHKINGENIVPVKSMSIMHTISNNSGKGELYMLFVIKKLISIESFDIRCIENNIRSLKQSYIINAFKTFV